MLWVETKRKSGKKRSKRKNANKRKKERRVVILV